MKRKTGERTEKKRTRKPKKPKSIHFRSRKKRPLSTELLFFLFLTLFPSNGVFLLRRGRGAPRDCACYADAASLGDHRRGRGGPLPARRRPIDLRPQSQWEGLDAGRAWHAHPLRQLERRHGEAGARDGQGARSGRGRGGRREEKRAGDDDGIDDSGIVVECCCCCCSCCSCCPSGWSSSGARRDAACSSSFCSGRSGTFFFFSFCCYRPSSSSSTNGISTSGSGTSSSSSSCSCSSCSSPPSRETGGSERRCCSRAHSRPPPPPPSRPSPAPAKAGSRPCRRHRGLRPHPPLRPRRRRRRPGARGGRRRRLQPRRPRAGRGGREGRRAPRRARRSLRGPAGLVLRVHPGGLPRRAGILQGQARGRRLRAAQDLRAAGGRGGGPGRRRGRRQAAGPLPRPLDPAVWAAGDGAPRGAEGGGLEGAGEERKRPWRRWRRKWWWWRKWWRRSFDFFHCSSLFFFSSLLLLLFLLRSRAPRPLGVGDLHGPPQDGAEASGRRQGDPVLAGAEPRREHSLRARELQQQRPLRRRSSESGESDDSDGDDDDAEGGSEASARAARSAQERRGPRGGRGREGGEGESREGGGGEGSRRRRCSTCCGSGIEWQRRQQGQRESWDAQVDEDGEVRLFLCILERIHHACRALCVSFCGEQV